jgi:hypothetical protein
MGLIRTPVRLVAATASVARAVACGALSGVRAVVSPGPGRGEEPAPTQAPPARSVIGSNPNRRYGSASSRSLSPKR